MTTEEKKKFFAKVVQVTRENIARVENDFNTKVANKTICLDEIKKDFVLYELSESLIQCICNCQTINSILTLVILIHSSTTAPVEIQAYLNHPSQPGDKFSRDSAYNCNSIRMYIHKPGTYCTLVSPKLKPKYYKPYYDTDNGIWLHLDLYSDSDESRLQRSVGCDPNYDICCESDEESDDSSLDGPVFPKKSTSKDSNASTEIDMSIIDNILKDRDSASDSNSNKDKEDSLKTQKSTSSEENNDVEVSVTRL